MKKLVFVALIAAGGLAATASASSAMTLAPVASPHVVASAGLQDVTWHKWHKPQHMHRGEGRDLHFHHDPHSQWYREHHRS